MAREVRNIIKIDRDLCTGCGQCVLDCAEGAIAIVDGKATVVSESYCDGLGACLSGCPQDALTIEQREADPFDEEAAMAHVARTKGKDVASCPGTTASEASPAAAASQVKPGFVFPMQGAAAGKPHGCPGSAFRDFATQGAGMPQAVPTGQAMRRLTWPVKLRLVPPQAPFLANAHIILAADCAPAASAFFHQEAHGRVVLIACPKFEDAAKMKSKLVSILRCAQPASVTVLRMEVPCCKGIVTICREACAACGMEDRVTEKVFGCDGQLKQQS